MQCLDAREQPSLLHFLCTLFLCLCHRVFMSLLLSLLIFPSLHISLSSLSLFLTRRLSLFSLHSKTAHPTQTSQGCSPASNASLRQSVHPLLHYSHPSVHHLSLYRFLQLQAFLRPPISLLLSHHFLFLLFSRRLLPFYWHLSPSSPVSLPSFLHPYLVSQPILPQHLTHSFLCVLYLSTFLSVNPQLSSAAPFLLYISLSCFRLPRMSSIPLWSAASRPRQRSVPGDRIWRENKYS